MHNFAKKLSFLLILALLGLMACAAPEEAPGAQPGTTTTTEQPAPADLPLLPRLDGSATAGGYGGGGGGGGDAVAPVAAEQATSYPSTEDGIMIDGKMGFAPYSVFSGTQFILNATLPTEPTQATVQRAPEYVLTADQANSLAAQFGFTGVVYQEILPASFYTTADGQAADPATLPRMPYYAFNGTAQLTITGYGVFYYDSGIKENYPSIVNYAQSAPVAEAWLRERGLLDSFPYVMEESYNGDVSFKRLVAGQPLNYPEIYVHLNDQYQIIYVNYSPIPGLQDLGNYPLISAQAAWDKVLGGVDENQIPYEILPSAEQLQPVVDPYAGQYQYWQRTFEAGDAITSYSGVQAFQPNDGGIPLVKTDRFIVSGAEEDLRGLAASTGRQIIIDGTIAADGTTLQLSSWRALEQDTYLETLYLEGTVQASDQPNTLLLTTIDGVNYLLQDAPADLPAGTAVYVFAWTSKDAGLAYPVLDWQNIDKKVEYTEATSGEVLIDPMPVEPGFGYGYGYSNVTITSVQLAYYYMPQWQAYPEDGSVPAFDAPPVMIQPVWKFTGTAVGQNEFNENIALFVQAVDPAFLQQ